MIQQALWPLLLIFSQASEPSRLVAVVNLTKQLYVTPDCEGRNVCDASTAPKYLLGNRWEAEVPANHENAREDREWSCNQEVRGQIVEPHIRVVR